MAKANVTLAELDKIQRALGNFVWLKRNLHNYYTLEFKQMLESSMDSAEESYDLLETRLKETRNEN